MPQERKIEDVERSCDLLRDALDGEVKWPPATVELLSSIVQAEATLALAREVRGVREIMDWVKAVQEEDATEEPESVAQTAETAAKETLIGLGRYLREQLNRGLSDDPRQNGVGPTAHLIADAIQEYGRQS